MRNLHKRESGIAAFVVVFMLMIVITLIVLGYTQIVRRNEQQALDRNLSTRAFYVAESGVNMVMDKLKNDPAAISGYGAAGKTTCEPDTTFPSTSYQIDTSSDAAITCLTIDTSPDKLEYTNIPSLTSQVVPLFGAAAYDRLTFSWQSTTAAASFPCAAAASPTFPSSSGASWTCNAPLLRVDLVAGGAGLSVANMPTKTYTFFLYPAGSGGTASAAFTNVAANQGNVHASVCAVAATPKQCKFTITGLAGQVYYARVMSLYGDSSLQIDALSGATPVDLIGTQVVIDVTGRSQEVSRRIQVRRPVQSNNLVPDFALQGADGICKRLLITPGGSASLDPADGSITDPTNPCGIR